MTFEELQAVASDMWQAYQRDLPAEVQVRDMTDGGDPLFVCPKCGEMLTTKNYARYYSKRMHFCMECGQRLEWSVAP